MINRELGVQEIYDRLYAAVGDLGLKGLKRSPTTTVDEDFLPCIFMVEDVDEIVEHSARSSAGYPCKRMLEVTLEIIASRETDVKKLYSDVRSVVFGDGVVVADDNTFIRETRTEGPTGYGLPDVLGMRLVLILFYTDKGT